MGGTAVALRGCEGAGPLLTSPVRGDAHGGGTHTRAFLPRERLREREVRRGPEARVTRRLAASMILLGVNIDHVATVRQARGTAYPSVVEAALAAERGGADGITVHLREDRRHIQDADVTALLGAVRTKLNLEMAATPEMVGIACRLRPADACLVPERRQELTTEGGLDVAGSGVSGGGGGATAARRRRARQSVHRRRSGADRRRQAYGGPTRSRSTPGATPMRSTRLHATLSWRACAPAPRAPAPPA